MGAMVRGGAVFAVFVAASIAAIVAVYAISTVGIFDHLPRNYNEGWNAYWAQAVLDGKPLYPAWDEPRVNNYPPLSFYVVAALSLATRDVIVSGRLISLAGILVTAFNVGAISAALTRSKSSALVAALFFLMAAGVWFQNYVAMNDPQWLGHAVQTTGALIVLARVEGRRSLAPVVLGAALMFLGCVVKHNLLVLPLTVWGLLFIKDRKACLVMTLTVLVLGCAFLLLALAIYGRPFFEQVLAYQRVIRFVRGVRYLFQFAFVLAPALVFALLNLALSPGDWRSRFPSVYALLACLLGGFALFGEGTYYNVLFDAAIATALTVGSLFTVLPELLESGGVGPALSPTLVALVLFAPMAVNVNELTAASERDVTLPGERRSPAPSWRRWPARRDRSHARFPAWCFWADRPFAYDVFNMAERAKRGGNEEARFANEVASGYYAAIETQSNARLTEEKTNRAYWDSLTRKYQLIISQPTEVWVRKTAGPS